MAPRAQWKGFLKFGEVTAPVALFTAASTSDRISFVTVNRATGNRVRRDYVDSVTGRLVEKDDQVKGYEIDKDRYIVLEPEEIAAAAPESDKTLRVEAFIACSEIDKTFFDKPYYLTPTDRLGMEAFTILRDGMRKSKVAAVAKAVLFRRMRTVLIRPHGLGLIATTLNFDYEVRAQAEAFDDMSEFRIEGEMLDLAKHIIATKRGLFTAGEAEDRYERALAELVKAKLEGRALPPKTAPKVSRPNDLLQALRESAGVAAAGKAPKKPAANVNGGPARGKAARPQPAAKETPAPQRRAG